MNLNNLLSQYFDNLLGDNAVNSEDISLKSDAKKIKRKNKHESTLKTKSEESSLPTPKKEKRQMVIDSNEKKRTENMTILDSVKEVDNGRRIKKKMSIGKEKKESCNTFSVNVERACDTQEMKNESSDKPGLKPTRTREKVTEDGYKVVSSIPKDDSDVSDAFEYDSDDDELSAVNVSHDFDKKTQDALRVPRKTSDGFKIVTEIPSDDSDVSDAFCEEDCVDAELDLPTRGCQLKDKRTFKKPILQLMDDFGFDDSILFEKRDTPRVTSTLTKKSKSKKGNSHTLAQAARKNQKEVVILDYTIKRGSGRKKPVSNEEDDDIGEKRELPSEAVMDEKELKRARYDVFKLGMSGFHKEKKQDTRIELAIKLGAKPPKNKAVSYKDLLIMKKQEKQKMSEELGMKQKMGHKVTKPMKNKLKDGKKVKGLSSQIGTFRDGVQVLSKKDIAKINAS